MRIQLSRLSPGTRFTITDLGMSGVLVYVNECRARVKLDGPQRRVEFTDREGNEREFTSQGGRYDNWAPTVVVEVQ